MKYTAEQLSEMSNNEIECAMHELRMDNQWRKPSYCSDWSATGPLMVEHGVALMQSANDDEWCAEISEGGVDNFACNKNPLRAICEVILMIGNEK